MHPEKLFYLEEEASFRVDIQSLLFLSICLELIDGPY